MFENNEEFQVYPQFLQEVSQYILQILLGLLSLFPSSTSCHLLSPLTIIKSEPSLIPSDKPSLSIEVRIYLHSGNANSVSFMDYH